MFKKWHLCFLFLLVQFISCDEHDHMYKDGEEVVLWMNTIGPYANRQETYGYFSLPFCRGPKEMIGHYHETLSEALQGVELEYSGLAVQFKEDVTKTAYCEITLTSESLKAFTYAVKNHYWYQMYIDDLAVWGVVGELDNGEAYVWSHKKFDMGYNGNRIVDVNLTSENKIKLETDVKISFTYEVHWKPSAVKFEDRFDKYLDPTFFQHRIHWFSIFNSFMMVLFLVGLVTMILLRTLHKDYARYARDEESDDIDRDLGDEYGWKQVHGEVFRPAQHATFFSALIGCGFHITAVTFCVIIFAILGELYTERGSLLSTALFAYALTSPVSGYAGGSLYSRMGGKKWIRQYLVTVLLLPVLIGGTVFFVNFFAIYYHATRMLHFKSILYIVAIGLFVLFPLTLVGTLVGRNVSGRPNAPCRVNAVPRPIPEKKWYMEPEVIIALGGILPFGSIFIEMYFIFTSFWAYKIYYVFGFMLLVFLILAVVTVCVTIVATYFLLNAEDYRWQWTSFLCSASTSVYVYLYAVYYFFFKTKMYGLFQTVFYFSYMAVFSMCLGIMCGTLGYIGASMFEMPEYKLHYFNSRGRAEPSRLILAYAGVKYEDVRVAKEDFPALKPKLPFGQLPVLEVDGKFLPQSMTIARYLAREFGLTGANNFEAAVADACADAITDLTLAAMPAYRETDPVKRKELGTKFVQEKLAPFVAFLEKRLTNNGGEFVVGKQLTWADLLIFNFVSEVVGRMGEDMLKDAPHVKEHHDKIAAIPSINKWVETRPKTDN